MADTGYDAFGGAAGSGQDGKEQIGVPSTRGTQSTNDDPSRSALHYGDEHRGDAHHDARKGDGETGSGVFGAEHGVAPESGSGAGSSDGQAGAGDAPAGIAISEGGPGGSAPAPTVFEGGGSPSPSPGVAFDPDLTPDAPPRSTPSETQQGAEETRAGGDRPRATQDNDGSETPELQAGQQSNESVPGTDPAPTGDTLEHSQSASSSEAAAGSESQAKVLEDTAPETVAPVVENRSPTDVTLSNGAVAANADGAVVGKMHTADPDAGDSHSYTVSDARFEVSDGVLKLREGQSLDGAPGTTVTIEVTATDPSGNAVEKSFEIELVDVPGTSVQSGFHARYFDVDQSLKLLEDIDWTAEPTHEELVSDINYENGRGSFWQDGATDTFGAQITGHVEVEEGGSFTFKLGGDDGAALFVNDVEVIENDGLHSYHSRSGEIELEPGTHHIEVRYFENYGHAGLKLEWEGPGIEGRELVAAPGPGDMQSVNGMSIALEMETDPAAASGDTALSLEGLPEGTLVEAGEDLVTVGADGAADVTGWDMSLVTVTPPVAFVGQIEAQIVTTVTTDSGQTAVTSEALNLQINPAVIEPMPVAMVGGFEASYFDVDQTLRKLDDIDWSATPTHTEMVREINYENGRGSFWEDGATDTFGAKLEGMIQVEEGGSYDFHLGGDDGVMLLIDGVEVVAYDGLQSYRTRSGEIDLEPGAHHVEVRYFENYGHAGLKLEWEGPGTDGRELVQADPNLTVPENGMLTVGIEAETLSDSASIQIQGLPAHTIVMTDGASAVSDGGPVDVSGWDIDAIEIAPPPGYVGEITGHIVLEDAAFNGETVQSTSEFSISVGEGGETTGPDGSDDAILLADASGAGGEDPNLLLLDDAGDSSDPHQDDVMAQPVEQPGEVDCSTLTMDSYERCDW
ncbi:MAG: PA14 domain-containing protein [Pseudomonadota bacterium]